MRIIIVGAGEVGSNIASNLAQTHEVVMIDRNSDRIEELTYSLDVLAMEGDGTSLETLEEARLEKADLLIASTEVDESNLAICGTAKAVGDPFTIARVKNAELLRTWERSRRAFSVDFMVCSTVLTAEDIVQVIGLPLSVDVNRFANGLVQMAEFEIIEESPLVGKTVREADQIDSLTFAAILRNKEVLIPRGDTTFTTEDRVVVIGSPESVYEFAQTTAPAEVSNETEDVFIVGGSEIGISVARQLHSQGLNVRLIEQNNERATEIAEELPEIVVLQNDATDTEFLNREHFGKAGAVITTLDSDQKNLLVSLLAKQLGAKRTISVVESEEYRDLFEAVGVNVAINPRVVTGEEIARFTREQIAEKLSFIEDFSAEVFEIEIDEESVLAGRPVKESISDLPSGVVIGAIARGDKMVTPRGDTTIKTEDHVILFTESEISETVNGLV